MAITNQERVGKAMELLRQGLAPFAEREFKSLHKAQAGAEALRYMGDDRQLARKPLAEWDVAAQLKLMWEAWNEVFGKTLGRAERSLVQELRDWRNKWAHQEPFTSDAADRALDYNGLVQSFPEIVRLAREGGKPKSEQGGLFADTEERSDL